MTEPLPLRSIGLLIAIAGLVVLLAGALRAATQPTGEAAGVPAFVQPGRCYRFTFAVTGAPNWKVLELAGRGWLKAEIDAGPNSAQREIVWVNTSQILTARDARCSD